MAFAPPVQDPIARNPMLPQHPLGAYTDAQYEQEMADLRASIGQRYSGLIQQLGYTDDQGNYVPGSVSVDAQRQQDDLSRSEDLAREEVTNEMQQGGTLFSGIRGTKQARAEFPFAQGMARLGVDTPVTLQGLHDQLGGLIGEFTQRSNASLAAAAARQAANITATGGAGGVQPAPAAPSIAAPGPGDVAGVTPDVPYQSAQTYQGLGVTPDAITGPGSAPSVSGPGLGSSTIDSSMTGSPGIGTNAMVDPHQAISDIHKASVGAIQKLAAGRDQRLGL